jgi:two-component system OmpR family response regulator
MNIALKPIVLLIEDNREFAEELSEFLQSYGIDVIWREALDDSFDDVLQNQPDLIILDQFLSGRDALTLLVDLRRHYKGGILVLTGNADATDRIVALENGADDFIAKGLGARELLARLRAVVRRLRMPPPQPAEARPASVPGQWRIDPIRATLHAPDGTLLPLTNAEFQMMHYLIRRAGQPASRDELSLAVLGRPCHSTDRSIDNLISRLRKALVPHVDSRTLIRSLRGQGYLFTGLDVVEVAPAYMAS